MVSPKEANHVWQNRYYHFEAGRYQEKKDFRRYFEKDGGKRVIELLPHEKR
jgi:hypothetical protein